LIGKAAVKEIAIDTETISMMMIETIDEDEA
jgi:hypothetical protein